MQRITLTVDHVVSQRAREQILALLTASHNRCGAASPAHHFASLPPLATAPLWDWCLHDTEALVVVTALLPFVDRVCFFTFGISCALMSVTREINNKLGCWACNGVCAWAAPISPNLEVVSITTMTTGTLSLFNVATQKMEELMTSSSCHFCSGNEKWWLHFDDLRTLTIANLIVGVEEGATSVISSRFEIQLLIHDEATANVLKCQGIFFNMKITDEAMLLMHDSVAELDLIVLIDIKNTFVTKKLSLLSFTKCLGQGEIVAGIFMIKSTGQHIFFVLIHLADYFDLMRPAVYEVAEGTGTRKSLSNDVESLSQLSSFLFCILKCDTSAEIWDCNNTSAALRVIASSISRLDVQSWPPVVAGPFLIATRHDHSHFEVVEASTGAKITTISLGSMIGMFDAVAFM